MFLLCIDKMCICMLFIRITVLNLQFVTTNHKCKYWFSFIMSNLNLNTFCIKEMKFLVSA